MPSALSHKHYIAMACCGKNGSNLGWATPLDAFNSGEDGREGLLYVIAVVPDHSRKFIPPSCLPQPLVRVAERNILATAGPDYLATIDADPESATYSQAGRIVAAGAEPVPAAQPPC